MLGTRHRVMFDISRVKTVGQKTGDEPSVGSSVVPRPRLQDKTLHEMADGGFCMSMHQPWASLLVYGIKQHEGRVWSSAHRGRLWIAAASKVGGQLMCVCFSLFLSFFVSLSSFFDVSSTRIFSLAMSA